MSDAAFGKARGIISGAARLDRVSGHPPPAVSRPSTLPDINHWNSDRPGRSGAPDAEVDLAAHPDLLEAIGEIGERLHGLAVGLNDDIAERAGGGIDAREAGTFGWRARH